MTILDHDFCTQASLARSPHLAYRVEQRERSSDGSCADDLSVRWGDLRKKKCAYTLPAHSALISHVRFERVAPADAAAWARAFRFEALTESAVRVVASAETPLDDGPPAQFVAIAEDVDPGSRELLELSFIILLGWKCGDLHSIEWQSRRLAIAGGSSGVESWQRLRPVPMAKSPVRALHPTARHSRPLVQKRNHPPH